MALPITPLEPTGEPGPPGRHVELVTSATIPPPPPAHLVRHRLVEAVDRGTQQPGLTLVTAGPGSGKTVLLSDWARTKATPPHWLALTRSDDDLLTFWRRVARVLRRPEPGRPWEDGREDASESGRGGRLAHAVLGDAGDRPEDGPELLVLDDAHVLGDPEIIDSLDLVVRRYGARLRLVVASRSLPLLPVHRYRVAGQLREVRASDLALTVDEAREILVAHGVRLSEADLVLLAERTEGWAAGVRLAALRLQESEDPATVVAGLAMDPGSTGEYLMAEVVARLPEQVRRLLVLTSPLDVVTGPVAEAITGLPRCEEVLSDLAGSNAFVTPIDAARTRFRYHPLLREVLRYLARREPAAERLAVGRRATAYFRDQGDVSAALQWAIGTGDARQVADVLAHGLVPAYVADRVEVLSTGRAHLPRAVEGWTQPEREALATARLVVDAAVPGAGPPDESAHGADVDAVGEDPLRDPVVDLNRRLALLLIAQRTGRHEELERRAASLLASDLSAGGQVPATGLRSRVLLLQARGRFVSGALGGLSELLATVVARPGRRARSPPRPRHSGSSLWPARTRVGCTRSTGCGRRWRDSCGHIPRSVGR